MKSIIALGLIACSSLMACQAADYDAMSVNNKEGVYSDSFSSSKIVVDFNQCAIYVDGIKDSEAEILHCETGAQFTLMWGNESGQAIATYSRMKNGKAAMAQVRIGSTQYISVMGMNVGSISVFPTR